VQQSFREDKLVEPCLNQGQTDLVPALGLLLCSAELWRHLPRWGAATVEMRAAEQLGRT
jgi:hypothetical protein